MESIVFLTNLIIVLIWFVFIIGCQQSNEYAEHSEIYP